MWRRSLLPLLSLMAVLAAGCAAGADAGWAATTQVSMPKSYKFAPGNITVAVGETVTWTNSDNFTHRVEFTDGDRWESEIAQPGKSVSHRFDQAGEFSYVCPFHPNDMKGRVRVEAR